MTQQASRGALSRQAREELRHKAVYALTELRAQPRWGEIWSLLAARRHFVRRNGHDVAYADALFLIRGFGPSDEDSGRYGQRLSACANGHVPPREQW